MTTDDVNNTQGASSLQGADTPREPEPTVNEASDAVGAEVGGELVGVAIVGNPLSARFMDGRTAEVLRLCTNDRAPKNTCSMLYAACARAWRAMGGWRVVTYTLATESGASLRAAGWQVAAECAAGQVGKNWNKGEKRREWQPIFGQQKFRWEVETGARPKNGASQPNDVSATQST